MRIEVRERPYDIYAIFAASTLLVLAIVIVPDIDALRLVLGLPFVLFFPGYVLISALYPERKRFFDAEGREVVTPSSSEDGREGDDAGGSDEGPEEVRPEGKGLDGLERIALSLGLSIAITPLIGLVLNYTYDWDPEHLGIRLVPILVSQYIFICVGGIAAIIRRSKVPAEDRFAIVLDLSMPKERSRADRFLTMGIVIMMVLSVSLLAYIIIVPREGESFTEFYILGPTKKAEGYPRNLLIGERSQLWIGIGNHEHHDMNYTLVLSISANATNTTVQDLNDVVMSTSVRPEMKVDVGDGLTTEMQCNVSFSMEGQYKLRFLLFVDGRQYNDVHLWVRVFTEDHLMTASDGTTEVFMAGPGGDPSLLTDEISIEGLLEFSVGVVNGGRSDRLVNISLSIGPASSWVQMDPSTGPVALEQGEGAFFTIYLEAGSSMDPVDIGLLYSFAPMTMYTLMVDIGIGAEGAVMYHPFTVGGT